VLEIIFSFLLVSSQSFEGLPLVSFEQALFSSFLLLLHCVKAHLLLVPTQG